MTSNNGVIDLLELEEVEGPEIMLPNRRTVRVQLFDGPHYQLWERLQNETDPDEANRGAEKLIRFAIPSITAEEITSLSPLMAHFIGRSAARQADSMLALLRKNVNRPGRPAPAPAAESPPPASTRKTKSSTSSSASRKRSTKGQNRKQSDDGQTASGP